MSTVAKPTRGFRALGGRHPTPSEPPREPEHRPVLDGVRGVAVLLVILMHKIKLPSGRPAGVAAAGVVAAFVAWAVFSKPTDERLSYLTAAGLALPALILLMESPKSPLTRLFSSPPLRYLGRVSYCVYLCHLLIRDLIQHCFPGQSIYFNLVTTLAASVVVGSVSWRLLESKIIIGGWARPTAP